MRVTFHCGTVHDGRQAVVQDAQAHEGHPVQQEVQPHHGDSAASLCPWWGGGRLFRIPLVTSLGADLTGPGLGLIALIIRFM